MRRTIEISTDQRETLVDITTEVEHIVRESGVTDGLIGLFAQGATGAIMIQENWDDSVQTDVVNLLAKLIPRGVWLHDRQDGNGDSHLKAGLVGPSETIPLIDGKLGLSRWQNIFFCEFGGPRESRKIVCTVLSDSSRKESP
jgi:secondary thiamine-phosphate synthase enzyme